MKITLKAVLIFLFFGLLAAPASSYAYWRGGHVWIGVGVPGPYYYGSPYYYGYPYYPYDYAAPAYVVSSSYQPVAVNGVTYYLNNGVYYTYGAYGYQAVATPAGAPAVVATAPVTTYSTVEAPVAQDVTATAASDDSITINIPNSKGSYTPVVLKRSGNGFTGPQGEYYATFPTVSQLQAAYGK